MPRHPPNALKALDHSHYRCPSFLRARSAKGATAFGYLSAFGCAPAALRRSCETSGGQHTRLVHRVLGLSIKERPVSRDLNAMPLARPGQRPCRAVVRQREPGQGRGIQPCALSRFALLESGCSRQAKPEWVGWMSEIEVPLVLSWKWT